MGRGGARLNAGAKPKWNNGETKTIRVPKNLADKILEYARKLDNNQVIEFGTSSKIINLSNMSIRFYDKKPFIYLEEFIKAEYEIRPKTLSVKTESSMDKNLSTKKSKGV